MAPSRFARLSGAVALLAGALVLVVQGFDLPVLGGFMSGWTAMKPTTALGFVLCGAALWLLQLAGRRGARAARLCALIVGGIVLLTLAEYASGWNPGINEFFLRNHGTIVNRGSMKTNAEFCFALTAAGLWLMSRPAGNTRRALILGWLGAIIVVLGVIVLLGFLAGFKLGYGWWMPTRMAVLPASLFVLFGGVVLAFAWREAGARWLLKPWITVGFASGLALLVAVAVTSHRNTVHLVEAADRVKHTLEALAKINELRCSIDENQSGLRGFVITGNESLLKLSEDAIPQALRQVRELTSDNPRQQPLIAMLGKQIDERWQIVRQIRELRRRAGFDEAAALTASGIGERAMTGIQGRLSEMEAEEQRLLKDRMAQSKAITDRTIGMLPLGVGLSLVFLGMGLLRLNRETAVRQQTADALLRSRQRLGLVLEAADIGEWFLDPVTLTASRSLKHDQIFGYAEMQPHWNYGMFLQHVHPEDRDRVDQIFQNDFVAGRGGAFECRIIRHDGTPGWIWVHGSAVKDEAGRTVEMLGMVRDITARKRAEEKLRESEERLRLAMDAAQMGSWDWDMLTGEILWTPHHEILFGYEAGTPRRGYADFHNRLHPDDVARVEARVQECLANRTDFHCEFRVVWPDGSCHWISGFGRFHYDAGGRPIRMLGMIEDVSERKQAEQEIRRLNAVLEQRVEERTRELRATNASLTDFKAALDEHALVTITDPDGHITYANDKFCAVSQYSREELIGRNHRIVNSGFHPKALMRDLWETIMNGRVWHGEIKNRAKDGSFHWVETTIVPFLDEGGKPAQFIAIRTDISTRKEAEAALELSDFCVRQASVATFWVAPDARILRVNPAVCELLGYTEPELLSMAITDLDPAFKAERWPSHWQELRELKRMSFETSHQHKDGHLIPIEVDLNWLEFEGQEYNFAFVRDVTARKAAEEEIGTLNAGLQSRAARLEIAVTELDAFSYSVAHDLRAPLRAVDGFSRLILKEQAAWLDDNGRRMLGAIRNESQRMGHLIDDLLAFSRLGRQQIEPVPIDMHAMAREVFDELAAHEPERTLQLDLQALPPACGTPQMIRQVWVNLIGNAIKFTQERWTGEIEIGAREGEDGVPVYHVKDNGAGFDMRFVEKLFGVFHRLHSQQEFPGTGVGLALVQRIVQRHGGRIWADAEVNRGATFYFTLPSQ